MLCDRCRQLNGLVSCIVMKARSTCGDTAAKFFFGAIPNLIPGLSAMTPPNCVINSEYNNMIISSNSLFPA